MVTKLEPVEPSPSPSPSHSSQPVRRRRPHKRSRNGCGQCKKRHIRCSEGKPVCSSCLVRGTDCQYGDDQSGLSPSARGSLEPSRSSTPTPSPSYFDDQSQSVALVSRPRITLSPAWLPMTASAVDPFNSLSVRMPFRSHEVFYHYIEYRHIMTSMIPFHRSSMEAAFLTVENPMHISNIIILSSLHLYWLSGSLRDIEETYLYHKLETLRNLTQLMAKGQFRSHGMPTNMILTLALVESGMGEIEAGATHMRGLFEVFNSKLTPKLASRKQYRYLDGLRRFILIAGSFATAAQASASRGSGTTTGDHPRRTSPSQPATPLFHQIGRDVIELVPNYFGVDGDTFPQAPAAGSTSAYLRVAPRNWATAFYLIAHLTFEYMWNPLDPIEPQLIWWLLRSPCLPADPSASEASMQLWLWKMSIGAHALLAGVTLYDAQVTSPPPQGGNPDSDNNNPISGVHRWFAALASRWMAGSGSYVSQLETMHEVVTKIAWLDTDDDQDGGGPAGSRLGGGAGRAYLRRLWIEATRNKNRELSPEVRQEACLEGLTNLALGMDDPSSAFGVDGATSRPAEPLALTG